MSSSITAIKQGLRIVYQENNKYVLANVILESINLTAKLFRGVTIHIVCFFKVNAFRKLIIFQATKIKINICG